MKPTLAAVLMMVAVAACDKQSTGLEQDAGGDIDARTIDARNIDARVDIDARLVDGAIDASVDARPDALPDALVSIDAALDASLPDAPPDAGPPPTAVTLFDADPFGTGATRFANGDPDLTNPFFASLGTNGRSCATCHDRAAGWSITPDSLNQRFNATDGLDPIFRTNDGSVTPNADVSTVDARRIAYSMLLNKGLIRVGLPIPAGADFTLDAVDDPHGFASAAELSLYRRPVPSTNLSFITTIMWDGREVSLNSQATDATLGHAQAASADPTQMLQIMAFELQLATAQSADTVAGDLSDGATGGPAAVAAQPFHPGINDSLGRDPNGDPFDPNVFTMYSSWATLTGSDAQTQQRLSIARGEAIFNTKTFAITNVPGIPNVANGHCSTCHDTPGLGGRSVNEPIALGIDSLAERTADLPLYTLKRISDGATIQTTDPGRAMITGKFADVGKFRVPTLRGLAMRSPYFHNAIVASLESVVGFYNNKFQINLSDQERTDLVAFLRAL